MQNSELLPLRLKPVNSAIRKGRLGWFGRAERKENTDLIKRCTKIKIGVRQRLGRKSRETGGTRGGRCNANCTSRFCHVSNFKHQITCITMRDAVGGAPFPNTLPLAPNQAF